MSAPFERAQCPRSHVILRKGTIVTCDNPPLAPLRAGGVSKSDISQKPPPESWPLPEEGKLPLDTDRFPSWEGPGVGKKNVKALPFAQYTNFPPLRCDMRECFQVKLHS